MCVCIGEEHVVITHMYMHYNTQTILPAYCLPVSMFDLVKPA